MYIVRAWDDADESTTDIAYFRSEKKAIRFTELKNKLEDDLVYSYEERPFDDNKFKLNSKVADYYHYYIDLDDEYTSEYDQTLENTTIKRIYDKNNIIVLDEYDLGTVIHGYSTKSFRVAKRIALDKYYELRKRKNIHSNTIW